MPATQAAAVQTYDFGAPASGSHTADDATRVVKFRVRENMGGKLTVRIEAQESSADLSVSLIVSADGTTYVATTASANNEAVSAVTVKRGCHADFEIVLRQGVDKFFALAATGAARGQMQIRESFLAIDRI